MAENELELDLSKVKISKEQVSAFFKNYGVLILVLITMFLAAYVRLVPANLPLADQWAASSVESYYRNSLTNQIRQQYPNLPDQNLNNLVNEQYTAFFAENKATINQQIKEAATQFRSYFEDENGYVYMPDIDPYVYLRYARNYLEHGYVGDEIKNGIQWDTHTVAPLGKPATSNPHPIVLAYLYKIMKIFSPKITLMQSSNYFPVIFATLCVIPIFFIARMFAGNMGGFFAAVMMAVNGAFVGRTSWGHADTDAYSILFAVYALWFFFLAIKTDDIKKISIYAALSGLVLGLFSIFWSGWWYVFDFMLATIGTYVLYLIVIEIKSISWSKLKENHALKRLVITSIIFLIASGLFVTLFTSFGTFITSLYHPIEFSNIKAASHASLWPNVYTTVAEMNSASISSIIESIGGKTFFYFSLLGIFLLMLTKTEGKRTNIQYALLTIFWYIGVIYASTKGIRFTSMLAVPLALGIGAASGIIYEKASEYLKHKGVPSKVTKISIIIILLLIFIPYTTGVANSIKNDVPMVNDAWVDVLTKIKNESQPNAIINSWWDFGHHFKYLADRAVTFDGASQNTPMAHWIGRVLLTSNEKEAIGILRMLDCGSNDAFENLNAFVNDTHTSVDMLYNIIVMDKTNAESYLIGKGINKPTVDVVLKNTHCDPPEDYFITSEDMVSKSAVWAHFGSWDFNKADVWVNARNMPMNDAIKYIEEKVGISEEDAKKMYFEVKSITNEVDANSWIAPWPGYGKEQGCSKKSNSLDCGGVLIDLGTKDVTINTDKGVQKPFSIVYSENNDFTEKKFEGGLPQSILLIKDGESYKILLASPEIATSMFTRLFYYGGAGTMQFSKFTEAMQPTGERVSIWKVKW